MSLEIFSVSVFKVLSLSLLINQILKNISIYGLTSITDSFCANVFATACIINVITIYIRFIVVNILK